MRRRIVLLTCVLALTIGIDLLPSLATAQACCMGEDRQRCRAAGCIAVCDLGACLCACPVP